MTAAGTVINAGDLEFDPTCAVCQHPFTLGDHAHLCDYEVLYDDGFRGVWWLCELCAEVAS